MLNENRKIDNESGTTYREYAFLPVRVRKLFCMALFVPFFFCVKHYYDK